MDPYEVLGLQRTASLEEVHAAYRERVQKYHPDRGGDAWAFKQVQDAFEQIGRERQATNEAREQQTAAADSPDKAASQTAENTPEPPFSTHSTPPSWARVLGHYMGFMWRKVNGLSPRAKVAIGSLAGLLLVVWSFGFAALLWGVLALTVIATGFFIILAFHEKSQDNRKWLCVFVGILALAGIWLWFAIDWWNSPEPFQAFPPSQHTATAVQDNASTKGDVNKKDSPSKILLPFRLRWVTPVFQEFGVFGVIVVFLILVYLRNSKPSK